MLFNGGVFKAEALRSRLLDVLGDWFAKPEAPKLLEGEHDLDHAAARGAAYYGWIKQRGGVRIRGGTARSYYVGIETAGLAVPGAPRPLRALCVAPFGMEEGTRVDVPGDEIGLIVGQTPSSAFSAPPRGGTTRPATCFHHGRRTTSKRPTRWKRYCRQTNRWKRPTCPSVSNRTSPNWAFWNFGASAPKATIAGNSNSACAKTRNNILRTFSVRASRIRHTECAVYIVLRHAVSISTWRR